MYTANDFGNQCLKGEELNKYWKVTVDYNQRIMINNDKVMIILGEYT